MSYPQPDLTVSRGLMLPLDYSYLMTVHRQNRTGQARLKNGIRGGRGLVGFLRFLLLEITFETIRSGGVGGV